MFGPASRAALSKGVCLRAFTRSCLALAPQPNPSMQALLNDVNMSLLNHKARPRPSPRELEALPLQAEEQELDEEHEELRGSMHRKSPAALYGSQHIGAVVVPSQLRSAVTSIIEASDKPQLHNDALRLFTVNDADGDQNGWQVQMSTKYRSYQQGARHEERDATAFISVAMPAHYAAVYAVLTHLKLRMESDWTIERVLDWGAASYAGLWASLYAFQNPTGDYEQNDLHAVQSGLQSYIAIDKREGLVAIGNRLLKEIPVSPTLSVQHRKTVKEEDILSRDVGDKTMALSAFVLSALPNPLQRKRLVKEMWESGAHTLVLIDQDSPAGFDAVAQARQYLLKLGRKEVDDPEMESSLIRGTHVVAPCPHDKPCPLFTGEASRLVCGFSQRVQRPAFVRLTKHSKSGHEDVRYSYVVIQRGPRPAQIKSNAGRIGLVGTRALHDHIAKTTPPKQLSLFGEPAAQTQTAALPKSGVNAPVMQGEGEPSTPEELQTLLRQEAYHWPRLIFPPMKKSGHVILDSCTPEGKIMRLTVPKSQGKQPYYDARKSSWGDLFPHPPKNSPQERSIVKGASGKVKSVVGDHIGKSRNKEDPQKKKNMYEMVKFSVRDAKMDKRRWEKLNKRDLVWKVDGAA